VYFTVAAVGCADLPAISDAWTVRDGDLAIVRCNHSRQVFHLKCNGNVWFGDLTNCSSGAGGTSLWRQFYLLQGGSKRKEPMIFVTITNYSCFSQFFHR